MIYFTSDLHFNHDKEFLWRPRGFSSIAEHDAQVIENWNRTVRPEDEVWILGDVFMGRDKAYGAQCLRALNGRAFFFILGNHDTAAKQEELVATGRAAVMTYATLQRFGHKHVYLSHFPTITSNMDDEKKPANRIFNLCGHSHTSDRWADWKARNAPIYHVELDAHANCPVSWDEVNEDLNKWLSNEKIAV